MNVELFGNSFCVCGLSVHPEINQFLIVTSNMLSQGMKSDFHKCSGSPDFSDTFPLSKCYWQISTPSKEDMASQIFLKPL